MRKTITLYAYALFAALLLFGCDSNDESGVPQVGGDYSGELRLTSADAPNISFNFPMTANVIQRDEDITIAAAIIVDGLRETFPAISGEISKTGFFTPSASGTVYYSPPADEDCGILESERESIRFENDFMIYDAEATYATCELSAIARLEKED